jgi:mersacidin/lichenicidin family type 2 lantibiotic
MNINSVSGLTPELIAKAWRSPEFAASLPAELQAQLPANPAGEAVATLLGDLPSSHHNTIACNTTQCHTSHCQTTICATTRATLCH